jgi:imidazolonepropionase-like amidohydrolase
MMALSVLSLIAAAPLAIVDVRVEVGDGTVIDPATVIVDGGRILRVGPAVAVPADAERIDGKGKVLTPGLVSTNAQAGLIEVNQESFTFDARLRGGAVPAFRAIDGYNPLSPRVAIDREQGVTTQILTPLGELLYGQGFAVELSGSLASREGARRVAMFGGFGGSARETAGGARGGVLLKLREIFDDVRFYRANRAAFDRANARPLALSRLHLEALIDVLDGRLPLVLDVDRAADIHALLAFAREQRVRVMVNGGAEAWTLASELAAARVPVILQPSSAEPYSFEALRARDDAPAILHAAGVPVILSAGPTDLGTTRTRQEAGLAVAHGLPRAAAIGAITLAPARAFGIDNEVGTVQAGKRANLVLWSGDPLETSTHAELVLVGGERMSLATRFKALAERYRRR